ncbi:SCO family protein [Persicimonas caeni]|nr:SCO family protein [Persicimonas caeni]
MTIFTNLSQFITGWRFATFVIALCVFMTLILTAILLIPTSETGLGAFATDFKTWCFGYDPATGSFEWGYVAVMLLNPLILAAFVAIVWAQPIGRALQRRKWAMISTVGVALVVAGSMGASFVMLGPSKVEATQLPFPAERLRTELTPPTFELTDQTGERVSLDDFKGEVVLLTAIYASCHTACPTIMVQARRALNSLTEAQREDVTVVAVTLDPENDTPERLAEAAVAHQVEAPEWRLVTGEPDEVNRVLDEMSVSRRTNPDTGVIEHSNLFAVIDRDGKIAYRLTLGDRHDTWLSTAVRTLVNEKTELQAATADTRKRGESSAHK